MPLYAVSRSGLIYGPRMRILKYETDKDGYQKVGLLPARRQKQKHRLVHRVVLETYVGPCPEGLVGCHNDGNILNNHIDNLRWDTHSANHMDKHEHGTIVNGSNHHFAKLNEDDVRAIWKRLKTGESLRSLASDYSVTGGAISHIKSRRNWWHLDLED